MGYDNFIQSKRHSVQDFGIKLNWLPDEMFDYQKHVAEAIQNLETASSRFRKAEQLSLI